MNNHGVTNGIFLGVSLIVMTLVLYLAGPEVFFKWWIALIASIAIYVFFMRRAGLAERADLGGYITFREALKPTFLTVVIGALISSLFTFLMYNVIDPGLVDQMRDYTLSTTENMMSRFGADQADIEKQMAELEQQDFTMTIGKIFQNYLVGLIFGFIIAAIISLVIRRQPEA